MFDTNKLPALDLEVGAPGSARHTPVVAGQVIAGIIIGVVIAVTNDAVSAE
ncbi:hypothetical protein [Sphingomonas psychrotolerans]|uniref:hypothetical protein n=1 Tax=Sphingomonas psychrotolerans TaxID=1327635 RepID=UPI0013051AC9|nr:hypothetical protein [Sphingomonas psychrotolerans]